MVQNNVQSKQQDRHIALPVEGSVCTQHDNRFRRLVGEASWARLPKAIQKRFGKRLSGGASLVYQGQVATIEMNLAGRILASLARLIGAPLPFDPSSVSRPAVVIVTEDEATDGQFWIRQYGRASGFPQTVSSSKRFAGPTGLEEYIGYGIGMALRLEATSHSLLFHSAGYFLEVAGRRVGLPGWMSPGDLVIGHHEMGGGRFNFSLRLTHRLFGTLIAQEAVFMDGEVVEGVATPRIIGHG